MKAEKVGVLVVVLLGFGGAVCAGYALCRVQLPGPVALTPPVGNVGSSASQVQQREFDERLKRLNDRIEADRNNELCWAKAQNWLRWVALLVNILLIAFAYITGKPAPSLPPGGTESANAGDTPQNATPGAAGGGPPRSWDSWVMLILATCAMAIQAVDKQMEKEKGENRAMVKRLDEATKKGRIAFADAKNDKEYQAAIDILADAERGIQ